MTAQDIPWMLQRAWAVLRAPGGAAMASYPLDHVVEGLQCMVALDALGIRHLLVPVSDERLTADAGRSALNVSVRPLVFGSKRGTYLDISCSEPDLNAEFDDLIADVLQELTGSPRPGATALHTIGRWRRLFHSRTMRGLDGQAKRGLFAELVLLRALLEADTPPAVDIWQGPLRAPHDFEAPRRCMEVKAVGRTSEGVIIHGIDQLDQHDARPLDLVVMVVVADAEGTTLARLAEQVRDRATNKPDLDALLEKAGWSAVSHRTDIETFTVAEVIRVGVGPATPKIIRASLVNGQLPADVSNLSYQLSWGAIDEHGHTVTLDQVVGDAL